MKNNFTIVGDMRLIAFSTGEGDLWLATCTHRDGVFKCYRAGGSGYRFRKEYSAAEKREIAAACASLIQQTNADLLHGSPRPSFPTAEEAIQSRLDVAREIVRQQLQDLSVN